MHWRARVDSGTNTVPEECDNRLAGDLPLCLVWVAVVDGRADCGHPGNRRAKPTGTFWRFRSQLRSEVRKDQVSVAVIIQNFPGFYFRRWPGQPHAAQQSWRLPERLVRAGRLG